MKEKLEKERILQWARTEDAYFKEVRKTVTRVIEQFWDTSYGLVSKTHTYSMDVEKHGHVRPQNNWFIDIVDGVCDKLNADPFFRGFKFEREDETSPAAIISITCVKT